MRYALLSSCRTVTVGNRSQGVRHFVLEEPGHNVNNMKHFGNIAISILLSGVCLIGSDHFRLLVMLFFFATVLKSLSKTRTNNGRPR